MLPPMRAPIAIAMFVMFASAASAQTICKYQDAEGKTTYSSRPQSGAAPVETFEHRYAPPVAPNAADAKAGAALDERQKLRVAALDRAWTEVRAATVALEEAEARLSAGAGPEEAESTTVSGTVATAPAPGKGDTQTTGVTPGDNTGGPGDTAVGGAQARAGAAAGGPQTAALPGVGGPMSNRRGGGRNAGFQDRMAALQADVNVKRVRLELALSTYHKLR